MKYQAAVIAAFVAACSAPQTVIQNTGSTIELTGGPSSIGSAAEGIEYHQPEADRLCQQAGHERAQSAGTKTDAFIISYLYSCTSA